MNGSWFQVATEEYSRRYQLWQRHSGVTHLATAGRQYAPLAQLGHAQPVRFRGVALAYVRRDRLALIDIGHSLFLESQVTGYA